MAGRSGILEDHSFSSRGDHVLFALSDFVYAGAFSIPRVSSFGLTQVNVIGRDAIRRASRLLQRPSGSRDKRTDKPGTGRYPNIPIAIASHTSQKARRMAQPIPGYLVFLIRY